MPRSWVYITAAIVIALAMLGAFSLTIAQQQLSSGERTATITGQAACLPHKKAFFGLFGGAETKECRLGLHGNDGNYYALNFLDGRSVELLFGARDSQEFITVAGAIRIPAPYEELDKYDIVGSIDVASATGLPETTTLYLFRPSPYATNDPITVHYGALYLKVRDMAGGLDPLTFEQAHYTLGPEGVFNYTGKRIDSYGNVRIVVSASITKPDGSSLVAEEISPQSRFHYASLWGAALIVEDSGEVIAWNPLYYDNPNKIGEDQMIRVAALPVEAQDVEKIESNYEQIRQAIESFELTEQDIEAYEKEYSRIVVR